MTTAIFLVITQRPVLIPYRRFETTFGPTVMGQEHKRTVLDSLR